MNLTDFQLKTVQSILNYEIAGNVKETTNDEKQCVLIVSCVGRLHIIELDHYLENRGITVRPNDTKTIKITIV